MNPFSTSDRPVFVTTFGSSDTGRTRSENQDSFLIADLSAAAGDGGYLLTSDPGQQHRPTSGGFTLGSRGALAMVADGMGGAAGGQTASRLAVSWVLRSLQSSWCLDRNCTPRQFAARLREALEEANQRILDQAKAQPEFHGMGTTTTAVGLLESFLYLAQVGDSRAYLARQGRVHQLTRDQSFVQALVEAGRITEEEAEQSGQRNVILQALGTAPEVQVDLTYQEARRGDVVIICSDGLSRVVRKEEIARAVDHVPDEVELCHGLVNLANARGGPDNVTVVAVRLDGAGLEEPMPGDEIGHRVFNAGP